MSGRVDRAYLEGRRKLCLEKAGEASDPGLARVYRNFADQYARALAAELTSDSGDPEAAASPSMLRR